MGSPSNCSKARTCSPPVVGDRIQSDDPEADSDEVDTWVMKRNQPIFRMGGKDLRTPFDHTVSHWTNDWSPCKEDLRKIELKNLK